MASNNRIIYYYQTFTGLTPILHENPETTHIHLSAFHFGNNTDPDETPYIHLNNNNPNDPVFDPVWKEIKAAAALGIKIVIMLGGAGGAYGNLFSNFETYYTLLHQTIKNHPEINGIDLDIEEEVTLDNCKKLINRIHTDFGDDFIIAMAPLGSSLGNDEPGMGGFIYKDLYTSPEGQYINYFNGQFYGSYQPSDYEKAILNGYPEEKVVMGMLEGIDFVGACQTLTALKVEYPNLGGTFIWEYFQAPPDGKADPSEWSKEINKIFNPPKSHSGFSFGSSFGSSLGSVGGYLRSFFPSLS